MAEDNSTLVKATGNLATRMGTECKTLRGEITANTTAITALTTQVADDILAAKNEVKNDLLGGAGEAYDTLKELADLIATNETAIQALEALAAGHVHYDKPQTLTAEQKAQAAANLGLDGLAADAITYSAQSLADDQKTQARANIDAASDTEFQALKTAVGDTANMNFVGMFETALTASSNQTNP